MTRHPMMKVLAGLVTAAGCAMAQSTVSARPGTINYVEGHAYVDGQEMDQSQIGHLNLDVDQTLRTDASSKAEILLTPGVFLRVGGNTEVKMVAPSLTDTRVAVTHGEALVDVAELFKDNHIEILDSGSSTTLLKTGLYRFNADSPMVAVIDGKAEVRDGDNKVKIGKGKEVPIAPGKLHANKFDRKAEDDLYAWSNLRSEYAAEASYASAKNIYVNNYGGWGAGWGGGWANGWMWNPYYSSWAFVPGDSYFYDPFGWGFYSPRYIAYAPIYYLPGTRRPVAVNPGRPPIVSGGLRGGVAGRAGVAALASPAPRTGLSYHAAPRMGATPRAMTRAVPMVRPGFGGGHVAAPRMAAPSAGAPRFGGGAMGGGVRRR